MLLGGKRLMVKRLTEKELRAREISKVLLKIRKLEKTHKEDIVKSACYKYNLVIQEKKSAEKDIRDAEQRLAAAKRRLLN